MTISTSSPAAKRIGRWVVVGAVALVLAGALAIPAGAMRRSEARALAVAISGICMNLGGDPAIAEAHGVTNPGELVGEGGGFSFICDLPDGTSTWSWYPYLYDEYIDAPSRDEPEVGPGRWRAGSSEQALTADARGDGAIDADTGKHKAQKHHKHKSRGGKHGKR